MMKKILLLSCLLISCFAFTSCGEEGYNSTYPQHDNHAWFTEEELQKVGLSSLLAPTGLEGEMQSDIHWFNDGYSFSQTCPNQDVLATNAELYLNYFQTNYKNCFGIQEFHASSPDTFYYYIRSKENLSAYYDDNPSPLYKFYYVTDTSLAEDGYLKEDAVWSLEIRYEFSTSKNTYDFKLFIEKESKSHNNVYQYKFTLK